MAISLSPHDDREKCQYPGSDKAGGLTKSSRFEGVFNVSYTEKAQIQGQSPDPASELARSARKRGTRVNPGSSPDLICDENPSFWSVQPNLRRLKSNLRSNDCPAPHPGHWLTPEGLASSVIVRSIRHGGSALPEQVAVPLPDAMAHWHEFYTMLGTASATLIGLLFVAATVSSGTFTSSRRAPLRVFLSASVVHFSGILAVCLIVLAPLQMWLQFGLLILGCGIFGLVYCGLIWRDSVRDKRSLQRSISRIGSGISWCPWSAICSKRRPALRCRYDWISGVRHWRAR